MKKALKFLRWVWAPIRKLLLLILIGLLEFVGVDVAPRIRVFFANRNILRKRTSLISIGGGQYQKSQEVDLVIKNGKNSRITKPAIVVEDQGKPWVRVIVHGESSTRLVNRSLLKSIKVIRKPAPKINGSTHPK